MLRQILSETKEAKSRLYMWGGEPMFHRRFDEILDVLAEDRREMTFVQMDYLLINIWTGFWICPKIWSY